MSDISVIFICQISKLVLGESADVYYNGDVYSPF